MAKSRVITHPAKGLKSLNWGFSLVFVFHWNRGTWMRWLRVGGRTIPYLTSSGNGAPPLSVHTAHRLWLSHWLVGPLSSPTLWLSLSYSSIHFRLTIHLTSPWENNSFSSPTAAKERTKARDRNFTLIWSSSRLRFFNFLPAASHFLWFHTQSSSCHEVSLLM